MKIVITLPMWLQVHVCVHACACFTKNIQATSLINIIYRSYIKEHRHPFKNCVHLLRHSILYNDNVTRNLSATIRVFAGSGENPVFHVPGVAILIWMPLI